MLLAAAATEAAGPASSAAPSSSAVPRAASSATAGHVAPAASHAAPAASHAAPAASHAAPAASHAGAVAASPPAKPASSVTAVPPTPSSKGNTGAPALVAPTTAPAAWSPLVTPAVRDAAKAEASREPAAGAKGEIAKPDSAKAESTKAESVKHEPAKNDAPTPAAAPRAESAAKAAPAKKDAPGKKTTDKDKGKPSKTSGSPSSGGASSATGNVAASAARPRGADAIGRRAVAGGPTLDDVAAGAETPEMAALREAERELFPPRPGATEPFPSELPPPFWPATSGPGVSTTGLPPSPPPPESLEGKDLSWLEHLELPELPVRWEPRLVRYLELFRTEPRWRNTFTAWLRRTGKYGERIRRAFRQKGLPEDLLWAGVVESGLDPTARSKAGAGGLWQLMPDVARMYGLRVDRWMDERMAIEVATDAAADMFADLFRRFGSWELALAGYNMGHAGLAGVIRKYNTNDYWVLARLEGALPWETTLHVPKVVAAAIVARNLSTFGYDKLLLDAPPAADLVHVPPATALATVAAAAGCTVKELEALNPELRASRTPPPGPEEPATFAVRVPAGKGPACNQRLAKSRKDGQLERYVMRFGETLELLAAERRTTVAKLVEINGIGKDEAVRGGTVLLVPRVPETRGAALGKPTTSPGPAPTGAAADAAAPEGDEAPSSPWGARGGEPVAVAPVKVTAPRRDATTPGAAGPLSTRSLPPSPKPTVIVPADVFVYPDRRRVFYRVLAGDTLQEIAAHFRVTLDDVRRWNDIDPSARLHEGMTLQVFAPREADLTKVVCLREDDVRVLPVGSDEFFSHWEEKRGRKRVVVAARQGDTLESIGKRYGVSAGSMERINHKNRTAVLAKGEQVVLYLSQSARVDKSSLAATPAATLDGPAALPTLGEAPIPEALPSVP